MSSLYYFTAGFTKAVARRSKEQPVQHVQKVKSHITESNVDTARVTPSTSSAMQSDEQYRAAIVTKMLNLIDKQKEKQND